MIRFGSRCKHRSSEWWTHLTLCVVWGSEFLFGMLSHLPVVRSIGPYLPYFIIPICAINGYEYWKKKINIYDISFIIICLLAFVFNIAFSKNVDVILLFTPSFIFTVLPFYLCGKIIDVKKVKSNLFIISAASMPIYVLYYLVYTLSSSYTGSFERGTDNIDAAYSLLPYTLVLIWSAFEEVNVYKKIMLILIVVWGVFTIISFGNRGVIVFLLIFILYYSMLFVNTKFTLLYRLLLFILIVTIYINVNQFVLFLDDILVNFGVSNRVTSMFLASSFMEGNSVELRDAMQDICMENLNSGNYLFGYGICGSWEFINTYPHNLIVDILFSFGYLGGGFILSCLFVIIIRGFLSAQRKCEKVFFVILCLISVLKLMVSNTYLGEPYLFMLIGYCVNLISTKNQNRLCH